MDDPVPMAVHIPVVLVVLDAGYRAMAVMFEADINGAGMEEVRNGVESGRV